MQLSINTSDRDRLVVGLDGEEFECEARMNTSQRLLSFIDELLLKKGKTARDITDIKVNIGPGSFTGLRVGVTVANTLGWVLGIPVNGKDIKKGESVEIVYD
jgi:tRNA threonylcarbamoyladenosine biosynthesis protein TsaB